MACFSLTSIPFQLLKMHATSPSGISHLPGLIPEQSGLQGGAGAGGVRVAVLGQHLLAHKVLDEVEGAAGGGVVAVRELSDAEGPAELVVAADLGPADQIEHGRGLSRAVLVREARWQIGELTVGRCHLLRGRFHFFLGGRSCLFQFSRFHDIKWRYFLNMHKN